MPQGITEQDLLRQLARLEARLSTLESASRVRSTGQPGGRFELNESDGTGTWMEWGEVTDRDGNTIFGFVVNGVDGDDRTKRSLEIGPKGLALPAQHGAMVPFKGALTSVSGTMETMYQCAFFLATSNAFRCTVPWSTDPGTTGEIRILNNVGGGAVTNIASLAAGSSGFVSVAWLHQQPISTGPFNPTVQARRTGGAGNVNVFAPADCYQLAGYLIGATAGGI